MKKKGRSYGVVKVCVLFSIIVVVSSLSFMWILSSPGREFHWLRVSFGDNNTSKLEVSKGELLLPDTLSIPTHKVLETATKEPVVIDERHPVPTQNLYLKPYIRTEQIHFIHIPKCGGTTMTTLLREIQCKADPVKNADCCLNPGFCDWHAHRRCSTIMGCINHFPNR